MNYLLKNEFLSATFNDKGVIIGLENLQECKGNIIASPDADGFVINFALDGCYENIGRGRDQSVYTISNGDNSLSFVCEELKYSNGRADDNYIGITAVFTVTLKQDKLVFSAQIKNPTDAMINDVEFPRLGLISSLGSDGLKLFNPEQTGVCYYNPAERVNGSIARMAGANKISKTYPAPLSMQWMALSDADSTLFFCGRDAGFAATEYRCEGTRTGVDTVTLVRNMLASVNPQEEKELPPLVVSLYKTNY